MGDAVGQKRIMGRGCKTQLENTGTANLGSIFNVMLKREGFMRVVEKHQIVY